MPVFDHAPALADAFRFAFRRSHRAWREVARRLRHGVGNRRDELILVVAPQRAGVRVRRADDDIAGRDARGLLDLRARLRTSSTGYFSVSSVTIATFFPLADRTSARTYRRVFTSDAFFGEGEPASVTASVGVMSTMPTPASMKPLGRGGFFISGKRNRRELKQRGKNNERILPQFWVKHGYFSSTLRLGASSI